MKQLVLLIIYSLVRNGSSNKIRFGDISLGHKFSPYLNNRIVRSSNCGQWTQWINENHPNPTTKSDKESMSAANLEAFCSISKGGNISKVECKDDHEEPFQGNQTSSRFFKSCFVAGATCLVVGNTSDHCPDLSIRYFCDCPPAATELLTVSGISKLTTSVAKTTTELLHSQRVSKGQSLIRSYADVNSTPKAFIITSTENYQSEHLTTDRDTGQSNANYQPQDNGQLSFPWWIAVLVLSVILFAINISVTVCLYKRTKSHNINNKVDPL